LSTPFVKNFKIFIKGLQAELNSRSLTWEKNKIGRTLRVNNRFEMISSIEMGISGQYSVYRTRARSGLAICLSSSNILIY